jgi:hypothetical protein
MRRGWGSTAGPVSGIFWLVHRDASAPYGLYAPGREGTAAWKGEENRRSAPSRTELTIYAPPRNAPPPAVHERLVVPETRAEILHGQLLWAAPADLPHGVQHFDLTTALGAYVAQGYKGAVDMLTRTSLENDFAPDASIFPAPKEDRSKKKKKGAGAASNKGERELEELAFEVVSAQAMRVPTDKARELVRRGVRRVFAIVVGKRQVLEWSRESDDWAVLAPGAEIDDRCLVQPLPVAALLDAAVRDDAVARALLAKHNRVLVQAQEESRKAGLLEGRVEGRVEGRREGILEGKRDALRTMLGARGLPLSKALRARIERCDEPTTLDRWIARAPSAPSAKEALRS